MRISVAARKEVMTMEWKNRPPEEKAKWLSQQLADIQRSQVLLKRFERLTQRHLEWVKRPKNRPRA